MLKVTRYLQDPSCCAIAACATVANFYNKSLNYEKTKEITLLKIFKKPSDIENGLDSGQICLLLNYLGFDKVTLVSTNLHYLDYSWAKLKRNKLLKELKEFIKRNRKKDYIDDCNSIYKWLKKEDYDNNIIIDYNFGERIRGYLDDNKPIVITFNWTMFFKRAKYKYEDIDPIKGEYEEHAVVVYGYDEKGVFVCDSHYSYYKYDLAKYRNGFYQIEWEKLMTIMGLGDVYIPEKYFLNNGNTSK